MGEKMGDFPVGPKNEPANKFTAPPGFFLHCLAGLHPFAIVIGCAACPEKTMCMYDKHILDAVATYLGKSTNSPGPCPSSCLQMFQPFTFACTYCLLYRGERASRELRSLNGRYVPALERAMLRRRFPRLPQLPPSNSRPTASCLAPNAELMVYDARK